MSYCSRLNLSHSSPTKPLTLKQSGKKGQGLWLREKEVLGRSGARDEE